MENIDKRTTPHPLFNSDTKTPLQALWVPWLMEFMIAGFTVHNCAGIDIMVFHCCYSDFQQSELAVPSSSTPAIAVYMPGLKNITQHGKNNYNKTFLC